MEENVARKGGKVRTRFWFGNLKSSEILESKEQMEIQLQLSKWI
jgi:hypothetical protein